MLHIILMLIWFGLRLLDDTGLSFWGLQFAVVQIHNTTCTKYHFNNWSEVFNIKFCKILVMRLCREWSRFNHRINNPKNWDTLTSYHTHPKILNNTIALRIYVNKTAEWVANSVDPDQIWVYTVCSGLFVPILRVIVVTYRIRPYYCTVR